MEIIIDADQSPHYVATVLCLCRLSESHSWERGGGLFLGPFCAKKNKKKHTHKNDEKA